MARQNNFWADVAAILIAGGIFGGGIHLFLDDWFALGATMAVTGLFMMRNALT